MRQSARILAGILIGIAGLVAACGGTSTTAMPAGPSIGPSAAPSVAPSAPASAGSSTAPSAGPSGAAIRAPAIVTFEVAGSERYKVELITQGLVDHAAALLARGSGAAIPLGTVVRGSPDVNAPWSWHIDPATLSFADVTIEVCDGLPSHVEDHTVTSPQYCPWSAKVVALEPKAAP